MLISCCNFPHFQVGHLPHISTDPGHGRWRAPARWRWWCRPRPRRWSWRPPVWSRPRPGCPASVGCRDVPNSLGILGGFVEWWTSIVWEIWGWMILNITWKSIQLEIQKKLGDWTNNLLLYLLEIMYPILGWCWILTFTNPWQSESKRPLELKFLFWDW